MESVSHWRLERAEVVVGSGQCAVLRVAVCLCGPLCLCCDCEFAALDS